MREERVSLRGKLVRDMMKNMMDSAMGHKFQTGEYRMNPVEPAWICPSEYEYEIVEMEKFHYWPTHSQQEFCSDECRRINHNRKTLEFYHKKKGNPKPDPEAVPTPKPKEDNAA